LKRNGVDRIISIQSPSHTAWYHKLQAGQLRSRCLIFGKGKSHFSSPEYPDQFWGLFSILFSGYWGQNSWGMKLTSHLQQNVKVQGEWNCTSTIPYASRVCTGTTLLSFTLFYIITSWQNFRAPDL